MLTLPLKAVQIILQLYFHKEQADGPFCTCMLMKPNIGLLGERFHFEHLEHEIRGGL